MSTTTPPGWYPEPGAPATERWWDGTAWTDHRRPAGRPQPVPRGFGPPVPLHPGTGPRPSGRGGRRAALVVAAAVLVAAAATGVAVLGSGDEPRAAGSPGTAKSTPAEPAPSASATEQEPAAEDLAVLTDQLNGITLPIPDGWERPDFSLDEASTVTTHGHYDCPGGGTCHYGTLSSRTTGPSDATTAEALAEEDIEKAADRAYGQDTLDRERFGGLTEHEVLTSGSVVVAGRTGHLVRWRVRTAEGPGGYVQSVVFPSPRGTEAMVTVRISLDAGPDGPDPKLLDTVIEGIEPIGGAADGGAGSKV